MSNLTRKSTQVLVKSTEHDKINVLNYTSRNENRAKSCFPLVKSIWARSRNLSSAIASVTWFASVLLFFLVALRLPLRYSSSYFVQTMHPFLTLLFKKWGFGGWKNCATTEHLRYSSKTKIFYFLPCTFFWAIEFFFWQVSLQIHKPVCYKTE